MEHPVEVKVTVSEDIPKILARLHLGRGHDRKVWFLEDLTGHIPRVRHRCSTPGSFSACAVTTPTRQSSFIAGHPGGAPVVTPVVYLERALINPAGSDPGREAVVVGNCLTKSQSLHGWQLVDRNGNVAKLDVDVPAGASAIVALDGSGVQLSNNGGYLLLKDDEGRQVDSVTYSPADAATVDRYVRFSR